MERSAMSKVQAEFLANMGHELRTPLNSVIGFTELLLDELSGPLSEPQRRYLEIVYQSGQDLLKRINDLLTLSQLEAGSFQSYGERVEVRKVIEEVLAEYRDRIEAKGLKLIFNLEEKIDWCLIDLHHFREIISNLVSNAVKFTDKGQVEVWVGLEGATLVVTVADSGPGISKEELPHIFEYSPFEERGLARRHPGLRLGLTLTRRIIEEMGGAIEVESEPGKGSRFRCRFPYRRPKSLESPIETKPAPAKESRTVLVVEDNPETAQLLCTWLEEAGWSPIVAQNGEEALRLAQERRPKAITLDIILPGMDGWQVLYQLKQLEATREIPVIICSIIDNRGFGVSLGAVDYLGKPISRKGLLDKLSHVVQPKTQGRKVLVVDDNPQDVMLVEEILRLDNYKVLKAYSGVEGLKRAREESPDLVILDLLMPDLSGFDLALLLRSDERTRNLPIIIFTVKELSPVERKGFGDQVKAIIEKGKLDREGMSKLIRETLSQLSTP